MIKARSYRCMCDDHVKYPHVYLDDVVRWDPHVYLDDVVRWDAGLGLYRSATQPKVAVPAISGHCGSRSSATRSRSSKGCTRGKGLSCHTSQRAKSIRL
jgi:hypothetical protein